MSQLLEFVREVFFEDESLEKAYNSYYRYLGVQRKEGQDYEDFFESKRSDMLKGLWNTAFEVSHHANGDKINSYANQRYHYNKMSITKWIATPLDKIGKDKTFYFLGKRFTKIKDVQKLCEHYNWTWEKKDPTKANFFILGDNPTVDEARFNTDLSKPVAMDDDLRVAMHFLFNEDVSIDEVDNDLVSMYLNKGGYSHLKLVISMIQYLKVDVLSDANRYRLIRSYVNSFGYSSGKVEFSLRNKDHVWMSDTVQRYCHSQHRYLVTNHFLKSSKWDIMRSGPRAGEIISYSCTLGLLSGVKDHSRNSFIYLHSCEGMHEVIKNDLEEFNNYSLIERPKYNPSNRYASLDIDTLIPSSMYKFRLKLTNRYPIVMYVKSNSDKELEILDIGLMHDSYSEQMKSETWKKVMSIHSWNKLKVIIKEGINTLVPYSEYNITTKVKVSELNEVALKIDEYFTKESFYENDQEKHLAELKFKARKLAILEA